jgi:hypothetical protein
MEITWKNAAIAYFEVLSRHLPRESEHPPVDVKW